MSVESGTTIADPFRATAPIVTMLRLRAEQMRREATPPSQRSTLLSLRRLKRSGGALA